MSQKEIVQASQAQPRQAPEIKRRLRFYRYQWIGIPLLMLLPLLALLGVFGETFATESASSDQLSAEVRYPTRFRYKMVNSIDLTLENTSGQTLETITVRFDRRYIDQFSTVSFTPSVTRITQDAYEVDLKDVPAGEARAITAEIQGEHYGSHQGSITAQVNGSEALHLDLSTIIFP